MADAGLPVPQFEDNSSFSELYEDCGYPIQDWFTDDAIEWMNGVQRIFDGCDAFSFVEPSGSTKPRPWARAWRMVQNLEANQ
jgi:hypothetical protein